MGKGDEKAVDPSVGLCGTCRWVRVQDTKRGERFIRCARSEKEAAYLRYPPLPVLRCAGFEATDA